MHNSAWIQIKRQLAIIFVMVTATVFLFPVVFFILLPPTLVLRLIVKLIAASFRPDLSEIYAGKGAVFATEPIFTRPKFNILLYCFCNTGTLPVEEFRSQFEQRVLNYTDHQGARPYEKLGQTLTKFMGSIFWKWDEDFNLANHIRLYDYTDPELALPSKCNENDLKRITGDLLAKAWVKGHSPWEILIVPDCCMKLDSEKAGSVAILRIHHSTVDGYGIFTMPKVGANMKTLQGRPTGPVVNGWLMELLGLFPARMVGIVGSKAMMTVGVTSIPGPEVSIYFIGDTQLTSMWLVLGYMSSVGAVAGVLTMAGKQKITLSVDKAIYEGFKVPTRFAEFVNQEIDDILTK